MYLDYKGINIFFTDQGKGNTVVFLHGFLENASMWQPFTPILSQNNRVITIDLLGHGKTGCLGYVHSMELMAEAVQAVLTHLKVSQFYIIGHSMGGYVALAFAEKNPAALKGLCLMNSTPNEDTPEKKKNRDRAIQAVKQNHNTFIQLAIGNLFSPNNRTTFTKNIKTLIQEAQQTPLQGIVAALEGMKIRKNRTSVFHSAPYKTMLIISKKDPILSYDTLLAQTKNTTVNIVELNDGHMSHIENKHEFSHNLMRFIEF
ncbi:alpha/beta hydrolase [Algibacter amylolyticus]|uniref:Alpha/beta hydrolase n=1 Tax=Algibacter amylolyticus TaxID=1608400 RepID=A0A5M7AXN0_9FLAO|nr:alpha/beta hydrolase [Algibacter amylolyticus]KAA5820858.1 alpha/beta hydrolase [Algibacter amylolyticus]MBB5269899.1 pimeloyl-ACP methyl ester carboxylesterase [Algibacter amylolyticus]TSJ71933.1 alpha/beta hydrolase [Algibacter amylolyticus]